MVFSLLGCIPENEGLRLMIAASLHDPMEETKNTFDSPLFIDYGGSTTLAHRIISGAEVDVFISAGYSPAELFSGKSKKKQVVNLFLKNSLMVVGGKHINDINSIKEMCESELEIAIADPKLAPLGVYTMEMLETYEECNSKSVKERLKLTLNSQVLLSTLQHGHVDLGIVYSSDTKTVHGMPYKIVLNKEEIFQPKIEYPIVIFERDKNSAMLKEFLLFIKSEKVKIIFARHGFELID